MSFLRRTIDRIRYFFHHSEKNDLSKSNSKIMKQDEDDSLKESVSLQSHINFLFQYQSANDIEREIIGLDKMVELRHKQIKNSI